MSHSNEKGKALDTPHAVTVLTSADGRRYRKIVDLKDPANIVEPDTIGMRFDVETVRVQNVQDFCSLISKLQERPDQLVIRGGLISGDLSAKGVYRRSRDRGSGTTGDREPATFHDVLRSWLAIDIDDLPVDDGFDRLDPEACLNRALEVLPEEFAGVSCVLQFTGSHMIKPGLRLRLWFLLDKALSSDQAKRWLMPCPVDKSIYRTVQPHFTAAPAFTPGSDDPVPRRTMVLHGSHERVCVPAWVLGAGHGVAGSGAAGRSSGGSGAPSKATGGSTFMPGGMQSWRQLLAHFSDTGERLAVLIELVPPDSSRPDLDRLLCFLRHRATTFNSLIDLIFGTAVHDIGTDIDVCAFADEVADALREGMTRAGRTKQDIERRVVELRGRLQRIVDQERKAAQAQLDRFDVIEPDPAPERDLDELKRDLQKQLSEGRDV
jgi:hypothetical protein